MKPPFRLAKAGHDQEFYIIMNLAVGGWFDGGRLPNQEDFPKSMLVDYVRVYKSGEIEVGEDGNDETRWSSDFSENAWFIIDLEQVYDINSRE